MAISEAIVIFVTTPTSKEAQRISDLLIEKKKAACVNIIPRIDSVFGWEGKVEQQQECLLIVKSKVSVLNEVTRLVKQSHSYEVPEIIAMPIVGGNEDYLMWLDDAVEE